LYETFENGKNKSSDEFVRSEFKYKCVCVLCIASREALKVLLSILKGHEHNSNNSPPVSIVEKGKCKGICTALHWIITMRSVVCNTESF